MLQATVEQQPDERRNEHRIRTLKRGMIVFNDRYCSTECRVRNESAGGALLLVEQSHAIPQTFEFRLYPNPEYRQAEIVWRTDEAMGIRFLDARKEAA